MLIQIYQRCEVIGSTALLIIMNFFKNLLGFQKDLSQRIKEFKAKGNLFEVIQTTRNIKLNSCVITFSQNAPQQYFVEFHGEKQQEYQLPVHANMNPVSFTINKGGKEYACFQWQLEQQTQHVGCYFEPQNKKQFKEIICLILKNLTNDENIKDHHVFCKELAGIPVYKSEVKTNKNVSSNISSEGKKAINDILIQQAQKEENKMVHTCSYYIVETRQRKLIQQNAIFVVKSYPDYQFEFRVLNATGFAILKKPVDANLSYEINVEQGYIRWIDVENDCRIVQVNFDGKRDAALSLKYNMFEVMYQLRARRKIDEEATSQEIVYMKNLEEQPKVEEVMKSKIVKIYEQKEEIEAGQGKTFLYADEQIKKGAHYNNFCQAKIEDFSIASLGALMETLKISEEGKIVQNHKNKLINRKGDEVNIGELFLHDGDSKAVIRGQNGHLYYQDLEKSMLIEEFAPNPKGIVAIYPEHKLAQTASFKTFKAISQSAIYEIDPRTKEGVGSLKQYTGNPQFNSISATGNGSFVTGAQNGEIRFFKQIGKNANNKFTSVGDPVLHLDTTKDGKWVLATFKRYLRLIPTENQEDISLFDRKLALNERPTPIRLDISLEDLQKNSIRDFSFLPAKFDESKERLERFIVSGFGEYTVLWNLGKVVKGDRSYLLTKNQGEVIQADFRFNDPSRLIMATSKGIVLKQNKIRS